jgi:hypothetical protein
MPFSISADFFAVLNQLFISLKPSVDNLHKLNIRFHGKTGAQIRQA